MLSRVTALRERLSESLHAFRAVFTNPNLRRLELAWAGSVTGFWSYTIALAVFAYDAGGAAAVGLVGLIRVLPAALFAPFAAGLGDRYRRERVLLGVSLVRALAMAAAAAAAFADASPPLLYGLAALVALVSTAFRPAQAALVPSLSKTPQELTAANVAASTIESAGVFVGPGLAGVLLAATSTGTVFAATAGIFLWSALLVSRIKPERGREERPAAVRQGMAREALAGFRAIAVDRGLRLIVGLYGAQTLVAGALGVLIVVSALELLDLGESGVGFLNSALGVGGLIGALGALALVGRRGLGSNFAVGLVLWGVPIALIGLLPDPSAALVFLAIVGFGNTIGDVAALTLLQRIVPDEVLARVFGVLQSVFVATIGLGAIVVPVLIAAFGIRGALVVTGALLPVLAALSWRRLLQIGVAAGVPRRELELLRSVPIFAALPAATLQNLASSLVPLRVAAGDDVFRQGEFGDRFYVIGAGEVEVAVDGRRASTLGPGGYFGEIALLRDVPRTATVKALGDVELYALERDEFIGAVTGHPASEAAANAAIATRLGTLRPDVASI